MRFALIPCVFPRDRKAVLVLNQSPLSKLLEVHLILAFSTIYK